jgi:2-dehydropantoate 2-reductase
MRVLVVGAGGVGGYFGARLVRAGTDVTFLARGAHLEAMRRQGLRIRSAADGEWTVKADAVSDLEGRPPADAVLFCVKSFDTETAAAVVKPVIGPGTAVLSIQNGVDNEEKLIPILGAGHVVGGMAQVFATIEEPGVIRHVQLGRIVFGEMDGRETPRVRAILQACEDAGIPAAITPDVTKTLWEKYVFLTAQAGMTAVTRCPVGLLRSRPATRLMYRRLLDEMVALARAAGVVLDDDYVEQSFTMIDGMAPGFASSLQYDLVNGKRLELEALHGHAVRLAERYGIATPTVFAVYAALLPHVDGAPAAAPAAAT